MKSEQTKTRRQIITVIIYSLLALALILALVFIVSTNMSQKMVCESPHANISILYNDEGITGYSSYGMSYDLEGQREYSSKIGLGAYLLEFEEWFEANTNGGVCHR